MDSFPSPAYYVIRDLISRLVGSEAPPHAQLELLKQLESELRNTHSRRDFQQSVTNDDIELVRTLLSRLVADVEGCCASFTDDRNLAQSVIFMMRIIRNICVNNTALAQDSLRKLGALEALSSTVRSMARAPISEERILFLRSFCQLLSNFLTQNVENQKVAWNHIYESDGDIPITCYCENLLYSTSNDQVLTPAQRQLVENLLGDLAMATYNLLAGSPHFRLRMLRDANIRFLQVLLRHLHDMPDATTNMENLTPGSDHGFYWPYLLIKAFFIYLPDVISSLESSHKSEDPRLVSKEVATLLSLIDCCIEARGLVFVEDTHLEYKDSRGAVVLSDSCAVALVALLNRLAEPIKEELLLAKNSKLEKMSAATKDSQLNAAFFILQIFQAIGLIATDTQKNMLVEKRFIETLIRLLEFAYIYGTPYMVSQNPMLKDIKLEQLPYDYGLRVAILSVIANFSYRNRAVQDAVRELNGIPLVLNGCKTDDANPWVREWSLFAVRNLCEENEENQKWISDLKPQGLSPDAVEQLNRYHMRAVYDEKTGRVRLLPNKVQPSEPKE